MNMSALDDMSIEELERLLKKYDDDNTGFKRQVEQALRKKYNELEA